MRGEERGFFFLFFLAFCEKIFYRSCLGFVKLGKIVSCRLERRAQDQVCSSASPMYSICCNLFYCSCNEMELFACWHYDLFIVSCLLYMLRFPYYLSYLILVIIWMHLVCGEGLTSCRCTRSLEQQSGATKREQLNSTISHWRLAIHSKVGTLSLAVRF